MHHRMALRFALLLTLAAGGCSSSDSLPPPADVAPPGGGTSEPPGLTTPPSPPPPPPGSPSPEVFRRSFVIVDHTTMAALDTELAMGTLLYQVNQYVLSRVPQWNADNPDNPKKTQTDREFAVQPFKGGSDDVEKNNAAEEGTRYGTSWPIVDTFRERIIPKFDPEKDPVGPFRLAAVVNRVDLTGDMDMRSGGQLAGVERRWFGEARFVYGLREPYDAATPFPMTFIMEYRLPALRKNESGAIEVDPSFDYFHGPKSMEDWIARRKLWPEVWARLASLEPGTPAYIDTLRGILRLFVTGKNHVTLRTGERVRSASDGRFTNELEYHEFYLNGNWALARRKMRREPFACSQHSILAGRIDDEWDANTNDLAWNYTTGERNLEDDEVTAAAAGCGGKLPYAQFDEDRGEGTQLRTKFARFTPDTVWRPLGATEQRRHAFAVGTCSGCHAKETATQGFHILPGLAGEDAKLSPFIAGAVRSTPNGVEYAYDEPGRRMELSRQFAAGVDVPGDVLHALDCFDADTCKVGKGK